MSLLIAFSGQGAQHTKMFEILSNDSFGKNWLKKASVLINIDLFDEIAVQNACNDPIKVQLLITILSVGAFYALRKQSHLDSILLAGYSLGELSAFCVSANLELPELCEIVNQRGLCMQQAAGSKASGLAALRGKINKLLLLKLLEDHSCYLAIVNGEDHYIVGGLLTHIKALLLNAKAIGIAKTELLNVKLPSHTPLLNGATKHFSVYLQRFSTYPMQHPILNALTQEQISNTEDMLSILAKELSKTLHWDRVMQIAVEYGTSTFLELGPGGGLKNMMRSSFSDIRAYSLEDFSSLEGLLKTTNP